MRLLLDDSRIDVNVNFEARNPALRVALELWKSIEKREIFEMLVKSSRFDLNNVIENGQTILHYAVMIKTEEYVEILLKEAVHGRLDVNKKDNKGWSATHVAFYFSMRNSRELKDPFTLNEFSSLVELILKYQKEANIDLEIRDNDGQTPLHLLYQTRSKKNVEQFLKLAKNEYNIEFDVNAKDHKGNVPADLSE